MADFEFTVVDLDAFNIPHPNNQTGVFNPAAGEVETITVTDNSNSVFQDNDTSGGSGRHSQFLDGDYGIGADGTGIYSTGYMTVTERAPDGTVLSTFRAYQLATDTNDNNTAATYGWVATTQPFIEGNTYTFSYSFPSGTSGNVAYGDLATFALPDGIVDGEETGEVMGPGYDDSGQATDGGGDIIDGVDGDDDIIHGNGGDDTIDAGAGSDVVYGGDGNDVVLDGNADNTSDTIYGGAGDDNLDGGGGADHIYGGVGNDTIDGGSGGDTIEGGAGDDYIFQSQNNGVLYDNQADSIDAGAGNDTIVGSFGADTIDGGDGIDLYDASPRGQQIVADLGSGTVEYLTTATTGANAQQISNIENFYGGHGSDSISGDGEDNVLHGNEGADTISGRGGDDTIDGGDGDDRLYGGEGNDQLDGGAGADRLYGNEGDDIMSGGDGDDYLRGGDGDDTLTGGDGDDAYRIYETTGQGAGHDIITDFGTGNTGPIDDGNRLNNDNINLSDFYNATNLAAWNAANPSQQYATPLAWLRADQADDGVLNNTFAGWDANNTLTIQNGGVAVAGSELTYDTTNVVCFARGTRIKTINGEIPVEELSQGDQVLTVDNGYQPIRWIGSRNFSAKQLLDHKNLRPVRIRAAALGNGFPETDLLVSQQHRILVSSKIAQRMFDGSPEVLVTAKHLVLIDGIDIVDSQGVEYFHFLFDRHEVIFSNGAKTESMYTGPETLKTVSAEARDEILTIFPDLASIDYRALPCRPLANGRMGRKLAIRHKNNTKILYS